MGAPYAEADLVPLSSLQHLLFCERQCALIHIEGLWSDNRLTAEGHLMHERVHDAGEETRAGVRTARGLKLRSLELGLYGIADVVEFHASPSGDGAPEQPVVVEYKRGRPKPTDCDRVQLCAQAMCLEEMLGKSLGAGAIFYGQPRRREEVAFTPSLRSAVQDAARRVHELLSSGITPPAQYASHCRNCSLVDLCLPRQRKRSSSVGSYMAGLFSDSDGQASTPQGS